LAFEKMRNESTSTEHKVKLSPFSTAQFWPENTVERLKCTEEEDEDIYLTRINNNHGNSTQ